SAHVLGRYLRSNSSIVRTAHVADCPLMTAPCPERQGQRRGHPVRAHTAGLGIGPCAVEPTATRRSTDGHDEPRAVVWSVPSPPPPLSAAAPTRPCERRREGPHLLRS